MCGIHRDEQGEEFTAIKDIKADPSFDRIVGEVMSDAGTEEDEPDADVTAVVDDLGAAMTTEDEEPPPPVSGED